MKKLSFPILFFLVILLKTFDTFSQNVDIRKITVSRYDEKVINDPLIDYKEFKTYSIGSANVLLNNRTLTLEEKQIEFFLLNAINPTLNLKNIPLNDSVQPDLMFVYNFSNDYNEQYIPPHTYTRTVWSPGTTTTISTNSNTSTVTTGDFNVVGNESGNNTTTITESGKWENTQEHVPAYTVGWFYPDFTLTIYRTSDNSKVWEGNAKGMSYKRDFRLAAQKLIWKLLPKMPRGSYVNTSMHENYTSLYGFDFLIFNSNGVNFYPVILNVTQMSLAYRKGFRKFDAVISINGESTANKTYEQIVDMISGNKEPKLDLVIDRKGRAIKKSLTKTR